MKKIKLGLLIEGIVAVILAVLLFISGTSHSLYLFIQPFIFIGSGLRMLSQQSFLGNVLAFLLFGMISLLPSIYLMIKYARRRFQKSDLILLIISAYLFYMLYYFINPGLMLNKVSSAFSNQDIIAAAQLPYTLLFYWLLLMYFIFLMLENLHSVKKSELNLYLCNKLQLILIIVSSLYTFSIGYFHTFSFLTDLKKYLEEYSLSKELSLTDNITSNFYPAALINNIFIPYSFLLNLIPVVFLILILVHSIQLLKSIADSHLQPKEVLAAKELGRISKITVIVTILCNFMVNLFQFIFSHQLQNINITLQISFAPLIFAFVAYIMAGFFKETMELQEENNMII